VPQSNGDEPTSQPQVEEANDFRDARENQQEPEFNANQPSPCPKDEKSDELHGTSANEGPPAFGMASNKVQRGGRRRQRRDSEIGIGLL
jgi:hypothetical protein